MKRRSFLAAVASACMAVPALDWSRVARAVLLPKWLFVWRYERVIHREAWMVMLCSHEEETGRCWVAMDMVPDEYYDRRLSTVEHALWKCAERAYWKEYGAFA